MRSSGSSKVFGRRGAAPTGSSTPLTKKNAGSKWSASSIEPTFIGLARSEGGGHRTSLSSVTTGQVFRSDVFLCGSKPHKCSSESWMVAEMNILVRESSAPKTSRLRIHILAAAAPHVSGNVANRGVEVQRLHERGRGRVGRRHARHNLAEPLAHNPIS